MSSEAVGLIVLPEHALLIVEERLREQQDEGVRMPEGMSLDELAPPAKITAAGGSGPPPGPGRHGLRGGGNDTCVIDPTDAHRSCEELVIPPV
jgi:hypothetical protein